MAAESAGAGLGIAKILASPGAIGVLSGAVGFLILWPKSSREGVSRLAVSGLSSHFFGEGMHSTVVHFLPWLANADIKAASYMLAGLPAWWILGAVVRWFGKRDGKDAGELALDVADSVKKLKEK